ncbi:hypothetical protein C8F04DRAFT_1270045 [Mycena alexandri]|uniref:Uncharacterized protein n=1 Tax=Mycena alexandri TaxID=1745969 RepID=A0AAD6SB91_9AGAR|nr:hypothetical protein C8F04DRAFT_1270045 [Mycena alexandri]
MIIKDASPPAYGSSGQVKASRAHAPGGLQLVYVYYRAYAPDGAIPSRMAPDVNDSFVGRIRANSVPPPLNVASLKRTLAHAEGLPDTLGFRTALYRFPLDQTPMDEAEKVSDSFLGTGTLFTPANALTLVFVDELTDQEKQGIPLTETVPFSEPIQYVYYRLHTRSGDDDSVNAFDPEEPAVGRIARALIAPPGDAQAVRRCIAKVEGKPIYAFADLYANAADEEPLAADVPVTVATPGSEFRVGSNPGNALSIVQPERRPGLYNRPLRVLLAQHATHPFIFSHLRQHAGPDLLAQHATLPLIFSRLRQHAGPDLEWLEVNPGDILYADGIVHHSWKPRAANFHLNAAQVVYVAVDSRGFRGMVLAGGLVSHLSSLVRSPTVAANVKLLDE